VFRFGVGGTATDTDCSGNIVPPTATAMATATATATTIIIIESPEACAHVIL